MSSQDQNGTAQLNYSIRGLANWVLDYAEEIGAPVTNMALNKLLYFAYEATLLNSKRVLTNAKIEAWEHGPVFREIYQAFKSFGDRPITSRASFFCVATMSPEITRPNLDPSIAAELKTALAPYMRLSASRLREISHRIDGPWFKVWWYRGTANPGMEITPRLILDSGDVAHEDR